MGVCMLWMGFGGGDATDEKMSNGLALLLISVAVRYGEGVYLKELPQD